MRFRSVPSFIRAISVALLVTVAAVGVTGCEPVTEPGCSLAPTDGLVRITLGTRSYLLLVPAGVEGKTGSGVPVVVTLHGLNSSASQAAGYTPWTAFAPTKGFVAVFPEGEGGTWHIEPGSADVAFVRDVIADVKARACVDPRRVWVDGHSLGAYLAQRLACDAADVVASVAAYAGGPPTLGGTTCTPSRPMAVALFHGEADRLVPPTLGAASRDGWAQRLSCGTPTITTLPDGAAWTYPGCPSPGALSWRTYPGQGHLWPTGAMGTDLRDRMWAWFTAHPRP